MIKDLIKLLNSPEEEDFYLEYGFGKGEVIFNADDNYLEEEIDTNQDYRETLAKIMGQIYSKREQMSKNSSKVMLLCAI